MRFMDEATLLAHALRDFLRPIVEFSELKWMDMDLNAGEPIMSIMSGLALCQELEISLPPIFEEKIMSLGGMTESEKVILARDFSNLPLWWQVAS